MWYLYRMGRKMTGARGMTIGTVLLLVTVGSLAVFTLVAVAFFHMRFSNVVVNQRSARNMAESALAMARAASGPAEAAASIPSAERESEAVRLRRVCRCSASAPDNSSRTTSRSSPA